GTVKYMAPEQVSDSASVGPEADVYSIAAVLYECLTGTAPHSGASEHALMFKILHERPRPLTEFGGGVSEALAAVVDRALARDPRRRYANAEELRSALKPFGRPERAQQVDAVKTTLHEAAPRRVQPRARWGMAPALLVSLGIGFLAGLLSSHRADATNAAL